MGPKVGGWYITARVTCRKCGKATRVEVGGAGAQFLFTCGICGESRLLRMRQDAAGGATAKKGEASAGKAGSREEQRKEPPELRLMGEDASHGEPSPQAIQSPLPERPHRKPAWTTIAMGACMAMALLFLFLAVKGVAAQLPARAPGSPASGASWASRASEALSPRGATALALILAILFGCAGATIKTGELIPSSVGMFLGVSAFYVSCGTMVALCKMLGSAGHPMLAGGIGVALLPFALGCWLVRGALRGHR